MSEPFKGPFRWSVDGNHWRIEDSESLLAAHAYWEKAAQWLCDRLNTLPTNAAGEREEFEREWAKRYPDTNDVLEWAPIKTAARVMWDAARPVPASGAAEVDFGESSFEHEGVTLTCRNVAPGLTMQDLTNAFDRAWQEASPQDALAGDPSKWPINRGVAAVTDLIVRAFLSRHAGQQGGDWVLVPREPDDGMIEAGHEALIEGREWGKLQCVADIYAAMLASSPAPQQARPGLTGESGRRWPEPGDKMVFLGENGHEFERDEAKKLFLIGGTYTVKSIDIGSWSHTINFEEVAGCFNGVMFRLCPPAAQDGGRG
jgi:hypothetical protein